MPTASGFTDPEQRAVDHELALRDLGDIAALRKFEPFERYWMRCVRQKHAAIMDDLHHSKCTKDEREELRQKMLLLEEILEMPAAHEASIRRTLPQGVATDQPT